MTTDKIHKQITLRAAPARVWRALSDAQEFASWFGCTMHDAFVVGKPARGSGSYKGNDFTLTLQIEQMVPEKLFAFRWHPYAIDPSVDYSKEPMTLVEISIAPAAEGTLVTVTESGFDKLPIERRAKAFEMNSGGWAAQLDNIARHVHA
jgi:uncharacterized protein YndB with AHSA1/START domain